MSDDLAEDRPSRLITRFVPVTGLALMLLFLIWNTGRAGLASLLYNYAQKTNQLAAANAAVNLSPGDPNAHAMRGALLEASNQLDAAIAEYEKAVQLRPDDFALWLSLARARELNGQVDQALTAARQALPLAPFYSQTHWQLGNLLVRAGQLETGFAELRLASASNPILLRATIDLAWQLSGRDVEFVKKAIQPQNAEQYDALAEYFRKHGEVTEAVLMFSSAGNDAEVIRAREQYAQELITTKRFREAYTLWSFGRAQDYSGNLVDPGFEREGKLGEPSFGWRTETKVQTIMFALEPVNPKQGKSSLKIEFTGDSNPALPIVSQLVLAEPNTHYQVSFVARTENIVSGALPRVTVVDAASKEILGETQPFPKAVNNWQDYTIDFKSKETTQAILISLQRETCAKLPCPIFGRVWLDNFSLLKL